MDSWRNVALDDELGALLCLSKTPLEVPVSKSSAVRISFCEASKWSNFCLVLRRKRD